MGIVHQGIRRTKEGWRAIAASRCTNWRQRVREPPAHVLSMMSTARSGLGDRLFRPPRMVAGMGDWRRPRAGQITREPRRARVCGGALCA
ncbi:hypothetical protein A6A08_03230 [Nocardiopsis sp. TSRI0078]|nr:hypothetical protein A6A08_03230 [Nocardiopsis sp. TSRI0078]